MTRCRWCTSARRRATHVGLVLAILWLDLLYRTVDALLLSVLPVFGRGAGARARVSRIVHGCGTA